MAFFSFVPWGANKRTAQRNQNVIPAAPTRGSARGPTPIGPSGQHSVPGRGPAGEVSPEEGEATSAFLLGVVTPVSSTWVHDIQFSIEDSTMIVGFHSRGGTVIKWFRYRDVDPSVAESFLFSPSKGRWANLHLKKAGWPYEEVGAFSGRIPHPQEG